jgi:hypothetical protein
VGEAILVLNAGSSSLKFSVFVAGDGLEPLFRGQVEALGAAPVFRAFVPERPGAPAIPRAYSDAGVRRYRAAATGRTIVAHWATGRASAPCGAGGASRRRWASPPWTAW